MTKRETPPFAAQQPMRERLSDLDAYRQLLRLSEETGDLSQRCWSTAASTAFAAASKVLRILASGLYRANLRE